MDFKKIPCLLLSLFLLASLPVSNAVSIGVKTGDKLVYDIASQGDLKSIAVGMEFYGLFKAAEIDFTGISGNLVNYSLILTFQNETKRTSPLSADLGDNSFDLWIIPAGLNPGDKITALDMPVNETRTETWLGVTRTICYFGYLTALPSGGGAILNATGHYDRETGICFSLFLGVSKGGAMLASLVFTIKSASVIPPPSQPPATGIPGFPIESILLGIAVAVAALTITRSKKRTV